MNKTATALLLAATLCVPMACEEQAGPNSTTETRPEPTTAPAPADRARTPDATAPRPDARQDADNTGRNVRDRDDATLTPPDQAENEADRKISAAVRRDVLDAPDMSTNARNVKVITQNGVVTLRGPVANQAEKDVIEARAKAVAGVTRVVNEIEVKSNP